MLILILLHASGIFSTAVERPCDFRVSACFHYTQLSPGPILSRASHNGPDHRTDSPASAGQNTQFGFHLTVPPEQLQ